MNPEHRFHSVQLVLKPPEIVGDKPTEPSFTLNFSLEGIDESLFFDEDLEESSHPKIESENTEKKQRSGLLEPDEQSTLFSEWLESTTPDEEVDFAKLPMVFQQAEKKGEKVAGQLKIVSAAGLGSVASVFSTLSSIIGACGPLCVHSLGAIASAGTSLGSAGGGFPGLALPGFSVDSKGNFSVTGNVGSLASSLGISQTDLLAGKYSSQEIIFRIFASFGKGIGLTFGFGLVETLIDCLFESFLPTTPGMVEMPAAA